MGDLSRYFSRSEFRCKGEDCHESGIGNCGQGTVDIDLLDCLNDLREYTGCRIDITSAHRCENHNKDVGGSERSQHLHGRAADFIIEGVHPHEAYNLVVKRHPHMSAGKYDTFTHIDSRSGDPKRWEG